MKIAIEVEELTAQMYRARCPALPGCVARGESLDAVTWEMDRAVRGYLASLEVPPPIEVEQQQNVRSQAASGQLMAYADVGV